MPRVRIAYDPFDLQSAGTVREVDADEARDLIEHGRAQLVEERDALRQRTNAELAEKLQALGHEVPAKATKSDLVKAVRAAESS